MFYYSINLIYFVFYFFVYNQLYGIESKKGEIIWQLRVNNFASLKKDSNVVLLYVQRGSQHFPHPPQCALIASDKV